MLNQSINQLLLLYVCSSVIVNDAVFVSSMSVDWLSRRLYWVDTAKVTVVLLISPKYRVRFVFEYTHRWNDKLIQYEIR